MNLFTKNGPAEGDTIAVWFSNGAASAIALQETLRRYGNLCNVVAINNPVAEEDSDNLRFAADVSAWLGCQIVYWRSKRFPNASAVEVWETERAMSFPFGAPCTRALKKHARQEYEAAHRVDWHVFGFTADEKDRHERFVLTERDNVLPILIEAGLSKQACYNRLIEAGIEPPRVYAMGFPNANCIGCSKAAGVTYWNNVRKTFPKVFQHRAEQSRRLGVRLVVYKGNRIFLDELPPDAVGRPLRLLKAPDCGVVCEEKPKRRRQPKTPQQEAAE